MNEKVVITVTIEIKAEDLKKLLESDENNEIEMEVHEDVQLS